MSRLLTELASRQDELKLTHLLVETTGVADPVPFIKLLARREEFKLLGVVAVVDLCSAQQLLQQPSAAASGTQPSIPGRGAAQLRCADVIVLNKADCGSNADAAASVRGLALRVAASIPPTRRDAACSEADCSTSREEAAELTPSVLGPVSFGEVQYEELRRTLQSAAAKHSGLAAAADAPSKNAALASTMSSFAFSFGPMSTAGVASHDASCETACIVLPRCSGCLRFDAALAVMQLLLDCGEVLRIQGYFSFLPQHAEQGPERRQEQGQNVRCALFPCLQSTWALPMVMVEGVFKGKLKVMAIEEAVASGAAARDAEAKNLQWQETALEAAAGDRGATKLFLCGRRLDEKAIKQQLLQAASAGFSGPLCNLTQLFPEAMKAAARLDGRTEKLMEAAGTGGLEALRARPRRPDAVPVADLESVRQERLVAEDFAASFSKALAAVDATCEKTEEVVSCQADIELPPAVARRLGGSAKTACLKWDGTGVSLSAQQQLASTAAAAAASAASIQAPVQLGNTSGGMRFCAPAATAKAAAPGPGDDYAAGVQVTNFEVLVLGDGVYCRQAK
eukprot:TRINITY_DN67481_c0_g1_i1.p1 TRINITY_DN67481_c0_g1~~TRINITY_DN67481_c0_g1_i1.p1  ORF type:complete len:596 (+),score=177.85 TRINITY_DN67481_c0_g1_i1:88-1788(+)